MTEVFSRIGKPIILSLSIFLSVDSTRSLELNKRTDGMMSIGYSSKKRKNKKFNKFGKNYF